MQTLKMPLRVLRHDCFEEKGKDNKVRESFSIEVGYEVGVPSCRLYINGVQAAQLKEHSGHGFRRSETEGQTLQPYNIVGEFAPITKQRVRRGDSARQDRVQNELGIRLVGLTIGKAA